MLGRRERFDAPLHLVQRASEAGARLSRGERGRHLVWEGCHNARDLGGLRTRDGRIVQSGAVVLGELLDAWVFGEGLEELGEVAARLSAVTARDIQDYAVAAFDPERRVEGVVRGKPR